MMGKLSKYIDGWLEFKDNSKLLAKFEKHWVSLKGTLDDNQKLVKADLFFFKNKDTHDQANYLGSLPIDVLDCGSVSGGKKDSHTFTIKSSGTKLHFKAQDILEKKKWMYVFSQLVGQQKPPEPLPDASKLLQPENETKKKLTKQKTECSPKPRRKEFNRSQTEKAPAVPPISKAMEDSIKNQRHNPNLDAGSQPLGNSLDSSMFNKLFNKRKAWSRRHSGSSNSFTSDPSASFDCSLLNISYFHGSKTRLEAEEMLANERVGTYLMRESESKVGSFTLSYRDTDRIKHHKIDPIGEGKYKFADAEVEILFDSPKDAVTFYMSQKSNAPFYPRALSTERRPSFDSDSYLPTEEINCHEKERLEEKTESARPTSVTEQNATKEPLAERKSGLPPNAKDYQNQKLPPVPESTRKLILRPQITVQSPPPDNYPTIDQMMRSRSVDVRSSNSRIRQENDKKDLLRKESNLETQISRKTPARKAPSLGEIGKMKEKQAYHSSLRNQERTIERESSLQPHLEDSVYLESIDEYSTRSEVPGVDDEYITVVPNATIDDDYVGMHPAETPPAPVENGMVEPPTVGRRPPIATPSRIKNDTVPDDQSYVDMDPHPTGRPGGIPTPEQNDTVPDDQSYVDMDPHPTGRPGGIPTPEQNGSVFADHSYVEMAEPPSTGRLGTVPTPPPVKSDAVNQYVDIDAPPSAGRPVPIPTPSPVNNGAVFDNEYVDIPAPSSAGRPVPIPTPSPVKNGHMLLSRDSRERPKLQKAYTTTTRVPLSSTPSKLSTRPSLSRPPLTKSKTSVQEEDDNYMNSIIAEMQAMKTKPRAAPPPLPPREMKPRM